MRHHAVRGFATRAISVMSLDPDKLRRIPIERSPVVSPDVFWDRYLTGCGKPVIVTDALKGWPALSKWSFEFFKSHFGSAYVVPTAQPSSQCMKMVKLADYIDVLDQPDAVLPGFWIDPISRLPLEMPPVMPRSPLYLAWNVFVKFPELLPDVILSPGFVDDWVPLLPPAFRTILDEATRYFLAGIMMGPKGSRSKLHFDFLHTHAYLAQIVGQKKCTLFSPQDSAALYDGKIQLDQPDYDRYPLFSEATAYEGILEPGNMLFIPPCWWHEVIAIENSITVNYNFFNRFNFGSFLTDLLRELPSVVHGLNQVPGARDALGIRWACKGFDIPKGDL